MQLLVSDLGTLAYEDALALQRAVARARIAGGIANDVLLLVEHPPVVTLGRTVRQRHLQVSAQYLAAHGVELFEVERGGDVTFHGPGQLVGYPILDLKGLRQDLHWYLRQLEEVLIRALGAEGLPAARNPGYTGVWTAGKAEAPAGASGPASGQPDAGTPAPVDHGGLRKIASIGVHARDWVTWHGFALNVSTDLRYFDLMVPCGIADVRMTSVAAELGRPVPMAAVRDRVVEQFADTFGYAEIATSDAGALGH